MKKRNKKNTHNILSFIAILILFFIFCAGGIRILNQNNTYLNPQANIRLPLLETSPAAPDASDTPDASGTPDVSATPDVFGNSGNNAQTGAFVSDDTDTKDTHTPNSTLTSVSFTKAPAGYFHDALFIGDSRTVGLMEYGSIDGAAFFASSGLSLYDIYKQRLTVKNMGKVDFETLIKNGKYSKVYVMLGVNELGGDSDNIFNKYAALLEKIKLYQPDAIIYIEANMHVAAKRSASDPIYNNVNINAFNSRIATLADHQRIFYLDVNPLFDDTSGCLRADYTHDNTHVLGKYYKIWADWIADNVVLP